MVSIVLALSVAGCQQPPLPASATTAPTEKTLSLTPWQLAATFAVEQLRFLPDATHGADRLAVSEQDGLALMNEAGEILSSQPGSFSGLDIRGAGDDLVLATFDRNRRQVRLQQFNIVSQQWSEPRYVPAQTFAVENLCLGRDPQGHLFLFLLGEEGQGEQWLVGQQAQVLKTPLPMRSLVLPPSAEFCQVDDSTQDLFVNETGTGLWQFSIDPETDLQRQPVAMRAPFGDLKASANAMAIVPGGVALLDQDAATLHLYARQHAAWRSVGLHVLSGLSQPQEFTVNMNAGTLQLWLRDDENGKQWLGQLPWQHASAETANVLPTLPAQVQTDTVSRPGDAADDPAIWIHPQDPTRSLILGTNKQEGLLVYGLDGRLRQSLPVGRLNNVDVRRDVALDPKQPEKLFDIAVASNRDHNSLSVFVIDRSSGELTLGGDIPTPLTDVYGTCLFQPSAHELHAFVNDKDGTYLQYRVLQTAGKWQGQEVRRFKLKSQPEACVADDKTQRLFVGEEDTGVWWLDARATAPANLQSVIEVSDVLHADVEGLGLYHEADRTLLVISSQGNDSYVVLDAQPPFALQGVFRVGMNVAAGIDGVSETDGLEVTSANLGDGFSAGLLVVQDGRKRLPEGTQNFKLVNWQDVAKMLQKAEPLETTQAASTRGVPHE